MELIQQSLKYFSPIIGRFSGFTETTDAIIPDSYPDIEEVAFSHATINVKDELTQADRILISGQIDSVILYRSPGANTLHRLNIPLSFAHVEETADIKTDVLHFMRYSVSQIDIRIVNSRKISVSCTCVIRPIYFQPSIIQLTNGVKDADNALEMQQQNTYVSLFTAADLKRFVVLDDLEVPQATESSPLHAEVDLRIADCSINNGRITLSGNAHLQIWDMNNDGTIFMRTHDIPFHQILDTKSLNDNVSTHVQLSCHSIICHYSNENILSININTEALFWQEQKIELKWINDLYHRTKTLKANYLPFSITSCSIVDDLNSSTSETLSTSHNISSILSSNLVCCSLLPAEDRAIKAILSCSILYLDESHILHHLQKQFTCTLTAVHATENMLPINLAFSCDTAVSGNQITLHIRSTGEILESSPITIQNLNELTIGSENTQADHPLKLIFDCNNRSLWQIAKENRSTVQLIRTYNEITENIDQITNSTLLVP